MYSNSQLRWTGPSVSYADPQPLRTPTYRHLLVVFALFIAVVFAGTSTVVKAIASKQVEYLPKTNAVNSSAVELNSASAPIQQSSTPQPAVAAAAPAPQDSSTKVQAVLNSWSANHVSQQWSVAIQGLGEDKTQASLNSSAKYDPASVFKLYFTYTLFQNYTLDSLSKNNVVVEGRGSVSMKDCLDLMIKNSDNPCGEAIGNRIGWGKTTTALRRLGMVNTNLNDLKGLTTTAADSNIFLEKLNAGELMSTESRQYVLALMQQQRYRQGIPAGCSECIVSNKTGDLGAVRHDVGIIQHAGNTYALSIMTNGAAFSQIAQLTSQIQAAL